MTNPEQSTYLFFTEGSSDKEYHAHLRRHPSIDEATGQQADLWVVQYANGPRGKVGTAKNKTAEPLPYAEALKAYEALVKSKKKSGYTESESGVRFTATVEGIQASGHAQMLPTAIDHETAMMLAIDPTFCAQEKANGERRSLEVVNGEVRGINKLGLYTAIPENIAAAFSCLQNAFIDGEQVGSQYFAFDFLSGGSLDLRAAGFDKRYATLCHAIEVIHKLHPEHAEDIQVLEAAFTSEEKRALLARIAAEGREGVVYKVVDSAYRPGRSTDALKYKILESASCEVIGHNSQRSVRLGLRNVAGAMLPVGNVTIPANFDVPRVGAIVEVEYLYYNPEGAFEQPVYLGERNDILHEEVNILQINRLKPGVEMDGMGRRIGGAAQQEGSMAEAVMASTSPVEARRKPGGRRP